MQHTIYRKQGNRLIIRCCNHGRCQHNILKVVKGGCCIDESTVSIATVDLGRMASYEGDIYSDIESVLLWKVKLPHKPFLMDVLSSKQKVLVILNDMRHVVIGAIAPVADIDIFCVW